MPDDTITADAATPPSPSSADAAITQFDAAREDTGKQIETLTAQVAEHKQTIDELRQQLAAADKRGDDQEARADKAEKAVATAKAKVTQADATPKPRKLGPIADAKVLDRDDLKAAIGAADKVEVAFSDGNTELAGSSPALVEGDAWRDHTLGLMLDRPVTVQAPFDGSGFQIVGYALVLDGKQAAWSERTSPLNVGPGSKLNIEQDIFF